MLRTSNFKKLILVLDTSYILLRYVAYAFHKQRILLGAIGKGTNGFLARSFNLRNGTEGASFFPLRDIIYFREIIFPKSEKLRSEVSHRLFVAVLGKNSTGKNT